MLVSTARGHSRVCAGVAPGATFLLGEAERLIWKPIVPEDTMRKLTLKEMQAVCRGTSVPAGAYCSPYGCYPPPPPPPGRCYGPYC